MILILWALIVDQLSYLLNQLAQFSLAILYHLNLHLNPGQAIDHYFYLIVLLDYCCDGVNDHNSISLDSDLSDCESSSAVQGLNPYFPRSRE